MTILLDTHMLIWALEQPEKVPAGIVEVLRTAGRGDVYFSFISSMEIVIKKSLGKLDTCLTPESIHNELIETGCRFLNFDPRAASILETLPFHHKDPFDRMLIAQAVRHDMVIATVDRVFEKYNIRILS